MAVSVIPWLGTIVRPCLCSGCTIELRKHVRNAAEWQKRTDFIEHCKSGCALDIRCHVLLYSRQTDTCYVYEHAQETVQQSTARNPTTRGTTCFVKQHRLGRLAVSAASASKDAGSKMTEVPTERRPSIAPTERPAERQTPSPTPLPLERQASLAPMEMPAERQTPSPTHTAQRSLTNAEDLTLVVARCGENLQVWVWRLRKSIQAQKGVHM